MTSGASSTRRTSAALLALFLILSAGIVTVGVLSFRAYTSSTRISVEDQLGAIAELKVKELLRWRQERLMDGALLFANPSFSSLVRQALDNPREAGARVEVQDWLRRLVETHNYDEVRFFDARGETRFSIPEELPAVSAATRSVIPGVMRSGLTTLQDFYRNNFTHRVHLAVLVPIIDGRNGDTPLGVLALRIDPEVYLYPFIQSWPIPSATAETLLVRQDGGKVVFLNELRFRTRSALVLTAPLSRTTMPAALAAAGRADVVEGVDYRGTPVLAALRQVPDSPWALVAKIDRAEFEAPIRARLWLLLLVVAVLVGGVGAGVGLLWRHQIHGFERQQFLDAQEQVWLQDVIARSVNEIYVFAPDDLRFRFVNAGALRNLGYNKAEIAALTPVDIKPELSTERFRAMVQPLVTGEREVLTFETIHRRKDGSDYPVEVHLQIVDSSSGRVFLAVINDITERKRAQEALRAGEERFHALFDSMAEGVALHEVVFDEKGSPVDYRILDINQAYERHTGIDRAGAVGKLGTVTYGTANPPYLEEFARVALTGGRFAFETWFPPLDRHFSISVTSPRRGQFATIFEDITERKKWEAELARKNEDLERFTYTISHDLKSPLVTVTTFLGFLEADIARGDAEKVRQDADFIRSAAEKMSQLLGELLEMSRIGRVVHPPVTTTFRQIVDEALGLVAGQIAARGVEVVVSDAEIPLVGDRPRLVEIWQNLIDNAVKFAGDVAAPRIELGVEGNGPDAVFFVRDNGIGIDPRFQGRVFTLFEKLDPSIPGTGLGLAMVKRIVELNGGTISLSSAGTGHGTCFRFTLPDAIRAARKGASDEG